VGEHGDNESQGCLLKYSCEEIVNKTIVLATDGLWDNYFLEEIGSHLGMYSDEDDLMDIAKQICS
jgi:serine/threonine protein phosphatase PrpC